jgi:CRISPR/Cas system-associated protein Csm6
MTKIITTVGTSLITNRAEHTDYARLQDCAAKEWDNEQRRIEQLKSIITNHQDFNQATSSAEIQSILTYRQQHPDETLEVHLIASDTVLSRLAAEMIQAWFNEKALDKFSITFESVQDVISGLQIQHYDVFRNQGMSALLERIDAIRVSGQDETILNISGGYKGVLPILTIYAQLYGLKLIYQYEDSEQLMQIDRMPLSFDWDVIEEYVELIKRDKKRAAAQPEQLDYLRNLHIVEKSDTNLTVLGRMLSQYVERHSPFTGTIMGYFIEHKLEQAYGEFYGPDKVKLGYKLDNKTYGDIGDIDLLIETAAGFITAEIKSVQFLFNQEQCEKLADKMIQRADGVHKEKQKNIKEVWLIVYSYHNNKEDVWQPDEYQQQSMQSITNRITANNYTFLIKHFRIDRNKLTAGERHIYQTFMKNSMKINDIKDVILNQP